jgi:hypothetical protein
MEIVKTITTLNVEGLSEYIRRYEYPSGIIDWVTLSPRKEYKLENGEWSLFNRETWQYEALTEEIPTWEKEYQEAVLAQYPFEKRVREIIGGISEDAENRVNHIMCQIADDVAFEDLVEEYIK